VSIVDYDFYSVQFRGTYCMAAGLCPLKLLAFQVMHRVNSVL